MRIENVKGIVWDLDGTLLDSFGIFEQVLADVVQQSGHVMPTREYMLNNYHGSLEETVQRVLGIGSAEELDEVISSFLEKQETHYAGDLETHLYNDASMLAQQAAKLEIRQLLVTNRFHKGRGNASPKAIIAATTLADCIQEVRTGDEIEYRKPDKRSVSDWIEKHQITPEELIVIGDQFVDAELAVNLGARAIITRRGVDIPHLNTLGKESLKNIIIVDGLENIELIPVRS